MNTFAKNLLWAIITLTLISYIFSVFSVPVAEPTKLSLGELATRINEGRVEEMKVNGEDLEIVLAGGEKAIAQKEAESGITETLKNFGVTPEALQKVRIAVKDESGWSFWAGVLIPTMLPILAIAFVFWLMFRNAKSGMNQAFTFGKSNMKLAGGESEKTRFKDVAGLNEAKEELVEVVDFLKNPKKFLDLGARIPRGVLLVGLPGTGKTLLARAVAGESKVPFFHVSASEFVEMFVGVGASRIRDAFMIAKKAAPSILFIDEIDAIGRQRGAGVGGGNDEREQTLNQILVELDGFDKEARLIVLAATNRPDVLDPALLRPGRFDRRVMLDLPDIRDREEILKIHAQGKTLDKSADLRKIAARTAGFAGADLANLMNEAAILTARANKKQIGQEELFEAVEKVVLGPERKTRVITDREKEITAYHESGHALVAASLEGSDPVHKVSIVSRGFAGGYTMKLPNEDERLRTKKQFMNDLAMMMGGYTSEKLTFASITTGASNDLKQATELARRLVTKYGMSDLGPITFGDTEEMVFLGREMAVQKNYSEQVASQIDAEVRKIITTAYEAAQKVISHNKKALKAIADALLEKETLEQEEFQRVLKPFKLKTMAM
jgi:cell division protease FtsH